ncbi:TonB-dependent siderophore receptor [Bosea psychrotolerans]|uniref:Iron complex outermembrane receptor protein n=1 Tax=Bosea psychrotolerans TaxID=1871628 RepID=A0A2S4M1M0_9HYPH|nr:TonB-dependent siderophore receptor [Bosea psychrotolerans]POR48614.1 iron complex outermembrane receptor protein [Bosea psychrotolerans]
MGQGAEISSRGTAGRKALLAALLATTSIGAGVTALVPSAFAQAARTSYSIPAGPLNQALTAFGRQSGLQITYLASVASGKTSPGVSGAVTREQALTRILQGSGLVYSFPNPTTVAISARAAGNGSVGADGAVVLDTIDVQGSADGNVGYVATRSAAGTKTSTPLIETPQSVSVVTRQELDDRNVQTLTQSVAYTPGVRSESSGFDPRFDAFYIRGFNATYNGVYRDGLRLPGNNMAVFKVAPYGVESVTVLRGPSSALYGLGSPGGLVDITSKRPVDQPFGEVELQAGSKNRVQSNFDVGGRLDPNGTLLYRLTGSVRDSHTANVVGGDDNLLNLAPAFTWRPNDQTKLTILGEFQDSKNPGGFPYYAWNGARSQTFLGSDPDYNSLAQTQNRIGYQFEHKFNEVFTVRQNLRWGQVDTKNRFTGDSGVDASGTVLNRYTGYVHDVLNSFAVDNQVQADFGTGPIQHRLLAGLDYTHLRLSDRIGYGTAPGLSLVTLQSLGRFTDPAFSTINRQTQDQIGAYIQEQAKFGRWTLTLSGRQDWVRTKTVDRVSTSRQEADDQAFTGRVGLTYQFDNGIAPYASYSTSFAPNLGVDPSGVPFKPTTAEQAEVGVKYAPTGFDGFFTASLFRITQDGGLVASDANPYVQVQRGEVRGQGLELEAVANLGAGFRVRGSYAYLDLETITGAAGTVGKVPVATPRHSFAAWTDYTVPDGLTLAGLGLGVGVRYTGSSYGDAQNTFKNDAVALVDATLNYDLGRVNPALKGWSAKVNAQNLFDTKYTTCEAGYCYKGTRSSVIASLRYRW